jgi:hypothetical protein
MRSAGASFWGLFTAAISIGMLVSCNNDNNPEKTVKVKTDILNTTRPDTSAGDFLTTIK